MNKYVKIGAGLAVALSLGIPLLVEHIQYSQSPYQPINASIRFPKSSIGSKENPQKRADFEMRQIADPKTNQLPYLIHRRELQFSRQIPTVDQQRSDDSKLRTKEETWKAVGPSNIGGRTRALAMDIRDENVMLAGGVSGGMYYTDNGGLTWEKTTHPLALSNSTCVVQDIRSGSEDVWYHGTGELLGNSARAPGAPFRGDGMFKSTDGGLSWNSIASTAQGSSQIFDFPFQYVWNIAVNHARSDIDEVFAAVYGGIVRSQDGGQSWQTVLGVDLLNGQFADLNESSAPFYTDILITPSGTYYAAVSTFTSNGHVAGNRGVFRSNDGENWENITPIGFSPLFTRVVMNYAPSQESILYFFVDGDIPQLWRYDGNWSNRSQQIPGVSDDIDEMDTQDSYNLSIHVHPSDTDIVFLGATNLYRNITGFESASSNTIIGGYDPENLNRNYPGHHPDHHNLVFYPSDPDKMVSATDGGLHITPNNTAAEVSWVSLDNNYVTSQFYTIALSQEGGSPLAIGGLQDNGTLLKSSDIDNTPWNPILGGDGSFCEILPGGFVWYVSFQEAQIFRLHFNQDFGLVAFARVDPVGVDSDDYLFINPYVLDPNNFNKMYLAGGNAIWRNNNLTQIPGGKQNKTAVNWTRLNSTSSANHIITALDLSTSPKNILYYGVWEATAGSPVGKVYKIDDATGTNPTVQLVHAQEGYIGNITIDPSDAAHAIFTYTNYNIRSVFTTFDGGATVQHIGGNLEENADGTGDGPSVRWSEIVPIADGSIKYFVGTTTGLFSSENLDGDNTLWLRESENEIGNSVVRMIDYRMADGRMIVATHGNGVFETSIPNTLVVAPDIEIVDRLIIADGYPNPFKDEITIKFTIPEDSPLAVRVYTLAGQRVKTLINYPQFQGDVLATWDGTNTSGVRMPNGMYHYVIFYQGNVCSGKMVLQN